MCSDLLTLLLVSDSNAASPTHFSTRGLGSHRVAHKLLYVWIPEDNCRTSTALTHASRRPPTSLCGGGLPLTHSSRRPLTSLRGGGLPLTRASRRPLPRPRDLVIGRQPQPWPPLCAMGTSPLNMMTQVPTLRRELGSQGQWPVPPLPPPRHSSRKNRPRCRWARSDGPLTSLRGGGLLIASPTNLYTLGLSKTMVEQALQQ